MASQLYAILSRIGYHHPLHPVFTHLTVGLIIAAFLFITLAYFRKNPKFAQSAEHCTVLALLAIVPTILFGYLDWQHFYGGASLFPIKMKLKLAVALALLLSAAVFAGIKSDRVTILQIMVHLLSLLAVLCIGYYGGELVYGKAAKPILTIDENAADSKSVAAGAEIFAKSCGFCHFTDSTDIKVGPGLKGLFQREKMPVSGWPVTDENLRRQLKTPFGQMPSFEGLSEEAIASLIDYIKSL